MEPTPPMPSASNSSAYYESDDPEFLVALQTAVLPGDVPEDVELKDVHVDEQPPPCSQPSLKRRLDSDVDDDTYGPSKFGGFGDYMRRKRAKLQVQNIAIGSGVDQKIFKSLAIYINGYTDPSVQVLRELIVQHGGIYHPYLDKKALVTHIITCSLTPAKIREFQNMKVVRPEWLVQSAEQGTLLPWRDFIFKPGQRAEATQGAPSTQSTLSTAPVPSEHVEQIQERGEARAPVYAAHKSNPNASRLMSDPNWRAAHTSAAPSFIEGYYKNSRLHHLSTWKAELRKLISEAQERAQVARDNSSHSARLLNAGTGTSMKNAKWALKSPSKSKGKGKAKATDNDEKVIMHCDFDCFFVAAGLLGRPQFKGQPSVVCHSQGGQGGMSSTSEIACASYEARAKGVKNGMSLQQARKLCPEIVTLPYEFEKYKEISLKFYTILLTHADEVEAVSVDEAMIDVTRALRDKVKNSTGVKDEAKEFAENLRKEVQAETGCEISIGISQNMLLARLATRRAKPAGAYHLISADAPTFLAPLSISDLPGFGYAAKQKIEEKFRTAILGDLLTRSKGELSEVLGPKTGETLWKAIRGVDERVLTSEKKRSSVSSEINYGIRFEDNIQARAFVFQMAEEIMKRDPKAPIEAPKVRKLQQLLDSLDIDFGQFLGHGACDVFNKQSPLSGIGGGATDDHLIIGDHAWRILKAFNFDPKELRGIGIHIGKLEPTRAASAATGPQGKLPFRFARSPTKKKVTRFAEAASIKPLVDPHPPEIKNEFDLPSFSQVDQDVYQALPSQIRNEVDEEYKRRSVTPVAGPSIPQYQSKGPVGTKAQNLRRIAQGLAPRSRSSLSPQLHRLLAAKPKGLSRSLRVPQEELQHLDIDPAVFGVLPPEIQREQLIMARHLKATGKLPAPPKKRKVLKPIFRSSLTPSKIHRRPFPKANFIQPAFLKQRGPKKGEKLYFSEIDDVQKLVEKWVNGFRETPPKEKDVEFFSKYLLQSVDGRQATDQGMERAIAVLKWWMVLLRRSWSEWEKPVSDSTQTQSVVGCGPRRITSEMVGRAWWRAFWKVKGAMDDIARIRFGGKLSLR
ncbi:deoxycytidyl transferase [Pleurotus pulmonarius]|nr:deoxycytidyl transferase [Pleurotus pulmonarius]